MPDQPNMPEEFSNNMPVTDTLEPFDVRDSSGMQGLTKLAIAAAVLLLLAFIVLKLYQPGVRDRSDPPRITADNIPFKVPPKDAGGAQTPNQDKVVFEVMDGKTPDANVNPSTLPETPVEVPTITAPQPIRTAPLDTVLETKPASQKPVVTAPKPRPAKPRPTPSISTGSSDYVVQVASLRSQGEAEATWRSIAQKFPALTSGLRSDIKRADLGDKGIYFRTRVDGLASKAAATQLCASFKAAGQSCFVTRR